MGVVDNVDLPLSGSLVVSNLDLIWALVVTDVGEWPFASLLRQFVSISSLLSMTKAQYPLIFTLLMLTMTEYCRKSLIAGPVFQPKDSRLLDMVRSIPWTST